MSPRRARVALSFVALSFLTGALACSRGGSAAQHEQTPAASGTAATVAPATPSTTAAATRTATPGDTPFPGTNLRIGTWTVVADRFRAQVSDPEGINIRSSPEVKPDNRTGSLPGGATVEVEGRVQGQEAVQGQGTTWYYLGTVGATGTPTPQFVYAPAGTLTPLTGSATAVPPASATATATPAATP